MNKRYRFPTAYTMWGEEEKDAIARVVAYGQFTMAGEVEAAESELAAYHGRRHCVMVNSGSSANLIAVDAVKRLSAGKSFDDGVAPALAWPTTYAPLHQRGIDFVVLDCDDSWNMNPLMLDHHNLVDADVVVMANILGLPGEIAKVEAWTKAKGIPLIEDNCESFGASVHGRLCGTFGLASTLSFYHSHQISAIEGGAILTDDTKLANLCRILRNHGWTKGVEVPRDFADEYKFVEFGYNLRPLELHAAVLRCQLKKADQMRLGRQRMRAAMMFGTKTFPIKHQFATDFAGANPFNFSFLVSGPKQRERLAKAFREADIDCRPIVGGSFGQQPYSVLDGILTDTPVADLVHKCGISVGLPPYFDGELIHCVKSVLEDCL